MYYIYREYYGFSKQTKTKFPNNNCIRIQTNSELLFYSDKTI